MSDTRRPEVVNLAVVNMTRQLQALTLLLGLAPLLAMVATVAVLKVYGHPGWIAAPVVAAIAVIVLCESVGRRPIKAAEGQPAGELMVQSVLRFAFCLAIVIVAVVASFVGHTALPAIVGGPLGTVLIAFEVWPGKRNVASALRPTV